MTKKISLFIAALSLIAITALASPDLAEARKQATLATLDFLSTYITDQKNIRKMILNPNPDILPGREAGKEVLFTDKTGEIPAVVLLFAMDEKNVVLGGCAASMIGPKHAYTAKHCFLHQASYYFVANDSYLKGNAKVENMAYVTRVYENCPASGWCKPTEDSLYIPFIPTLKIDERAGSDGVVFEIDSDLGKTTGYFELHDPKDSLFSIKLQIAGYPSFASAATGVNMKYISDPVCDVTADTSSFLITNCIPASGLSGGPLFYRKEGRLILVGNVSSSIGPLIEPNGKYVIIGTTHNSAYKSDLVKRFIAKPTMVDHFRETKVKQGK